MSVFVSVGKHKGEPVVTVRYGDRSQKHYPLTAAGCRQAGAELHAAGVEDWMHSSSVNWPNEVKPTFRGDVSEYMGQGFRAAMKKEEEPRKRLVAKMMAAAALPAFQATLTDDEKDAYVKLAKRIADGDKDGDE